MKIIDAVPKTDTAPAGRSAAKKAIKDLRSKLDEMIMDLRQLSYTEFYKKYMEKL